MLILLAELLLLVLLCFGSHGCERTCCAVVFVVCLMLPLLRGWSLDFLGTHCSGWSVGRSDVMGLFCFYFVGHEKKDVERRAEN